MLNLQKTIKAVLVTAVLTSAIAGQAFAGNWQSLC